MYRQMKNKQTITYTYVERGTKTAIKIFNLSIFNKISKFHEFYGMSQNLLLFFLRKPVIFISCTVNVDRPISDHE